MDFNQVTRLEEELPNNQGLSPVPLASNRLLRQEVKCLYTKTNNCLLRQEVKGL